MLGIGKLAAGAEDYYVGMASTGLLIDPWTSTCASSNGFRFENGITSESRAFGKHEEDWQTERHLDPGQHEIDPPQRSPGMRR